MTKQYRLYEDNTLVIPSGRMAGVFGFLEGDGAGHYLQKRVKFASAELAEEFINRVDDLRWCDDFDQNESMYFRTWYKD